MISTSSAIRSLRRFTTFRPSAARHFPASTTSVDQRKILDDVICVGWDGHPLVDSPDKSDGSKDRGDTNTRLFEKTTHPTEAGDVVSFSPAMAGSYVTPDSGAQGTGFQTSYYGGGTVGGIVKYKEEDEVDGVDEAMSLAERLFQERRERGDPDSPQAKVLAKMGRSDCTSKESQERAEEKRTINGEKEVS